MQVDFAGAWRYIAADDASGEAIHKVGVPWKTSINPCHSISWLVTLGVGWKGYLGGHASLWQWCHSSSELAIQAKCVNEDILG